MGTRTILEENRDKVIISNLIGINKQLERIADILEKIYGKTKEDVV